MSGERRQPTRSSSDDPQRADRRTRTAARRILLTLVDRVLAEGWLAIRDFESSSSQRTAKLTPAPSAVGEGARPLQHPAVVVFETFSFPPTIPIFPTVLMNTAKSVTLTVFCINVRVRGQ